MIILFLFLGIMFVVSGLKGTETELAKQLEGDLVGANGKSGFIVWLIALIVVGSLGYIPYLQKPSRYLMALIVVVIFLANKGVVSQLFNAIGSYESAGPSQPVALPAVTAPASTSGSGSSSSSSSSGGSSTSSILGTIGTIASIAAFF